MMVVLEYTVALAVGYLIVATIANRKLGKHLPVPKFIGFAQPK